MRSCSAEAVWCGGHTLHHAWLTEQALVDDLVGMHLRKVVLHSATSAVASAGRGPTGPVSYDLDVTTDPFWSKHCREPFPNAIEGHEAELKVSSCAIACSPCSGNRLSCRSAAVLLLHNDPTHLPVGPAAG
jgi:hypothetical protein